MIIKVPKHDSTIMNRNGWSFDENIKPGVEGKLVTVWPDNKFSVPREHHIGIVVMKEEYIEVDIEDLDIAAQLEYGELVLNHALASYGPIAGETVREVVSNSPWFCRVSVRAESAIEFHHTKEYDEQLKKLREGDNAPGTSTETDG